MNQLLYAEKNYHGLSINCKLQKAYLLTESTMSVAFSQSTVPFSAQIQFTIFHVSFPQSILPINQPIDQGVRHAIENSIEYAIIQSSEHQSERRLFIQSTRRSRILSKNEEFEKKFEFQFLKYQSNSRNDVKYQSNFRNDVRYQSDPRNNRYQLNFRDKVRSNRDRNEIENDKYNSKFQNAKKQQKFYYEIFINSNLHFIRLLNRCIQCINQCIHFHLEPLCDPIHFKFNQLENQYFNDRIRL